MPADNARFSSAATSCGKRGCNGTNHQRQAARRYVQARATVQRDNEEEK